MSYHDFLAEKVRFDHACGIPTTADQVARWYPQLLPHQAAIAAWAITGGRRAIFANFGLGKTFMQLVVAKSMLDLQPGGAAHSGNAALITRYSNPGELVYDPFGGLFTVPVRALHLGRKGRAAELNTGYFMDGVKYLQAKEREKAMPSLFDALPAPHAEVA